MTEEELKVYYAEILDFWRFAKMHLKHGIQQDYDWDVLLEEAREFGKGHEHSDFCDYLAIAVINEIERREKVKT